MDRMRERWARAGIDLLVGVLLAAVSSGCATGPSGGPLRATVKVTPLGSHDGEFCAQDRALVFEDPNGTRILYDAGRTVRGGADPRLGRIDAVLLTHVHADHLGDAVATGPNAGTCAHPEFAEKIAPGSNTVNIAVARHATLVVGGEMGKYFSLKVKEAGGDPGLVRLLRIGATTEIGGVAISTVTAVHSNGLDPIFLHKEAAEALESNGLTAYMGPPNGFVLRFTNGLAVYLSGDTGVTADQFAVVRHLYQAKLVVLNIGGTFTTGPPEAAYVVNELIEPASVIASHANEAATVGGKLQPGTRTEAFRHLAHMPVYVPLSGQTLQFGADGVCVGGC
jgi:L-ascorbate metabolism protein UlaG (beta-lactamase superfamily)